MVYTHIVLRPFQAGGFEVSVGQPVDASEWKNAERLVNTKYLRPMNEVDQARLRKSKNVIKGKPLETATPPPKRFFLKKRKGR